MKVSSRSAVNRMFKSLAMGVLLGGWGALPLSAATTAWWRFDEQAPGHVVAASTETLVDAVSGVKAEPVTVIKRETTWQQNETRPRYVRPFVSGFVYDPVSGVRKQNQSALRFTTAPSQTGIPSCYGSAVRVPGDAAGAVAATQPTDAITVEFFCCTTGGAFNALAPLVAKRNGSSWSAESWAVYQRKDGNLALRLRTGTSGASLYGHSAPYGKAKINDGNWHHVAFTYDKATSRARVYVDYVLDQDIEHAAGGPIAYDANTTTPNYHALWIGGSGSYDDTYGGRSFNGCVDEVRISDVALTPEQFLRMELPDTYRLSFAPSSHDETVVVAGRNLSDSLTVPAKFVRVATDVTVETDEKIAATVRDGFFSAAASNAAALSFQTNETGTCGYLKAENFTKAMFGNTNASFTAECFFKARGKLARTEAARQCLFQFGEKPTAKILLDAATPGAMNYSVNSNNVWLGSAGRAGRTADDGNWHHVALVYDHAGHQVRCYYDYRLDWYAFGVTNIMSKDASLFVGASRNVAVAGKGASDWQYFDGWIDDVRITRAALAPEAFLCTHDVAVQADDPTRLFVAFDNDRKTGPYPAFTGEWESGPNVAGASDVSFAPPRSCGVLLGEGETAVRLENRASLALDGAHVGFPYSPLYEQEALTVEFFGKFSRVDTSANLIRYTDGVTSYVGSNPVWALYRKDETNPCLQFRLALINESGVRFYDYSFMFDIPGLEDKRWHHYAFTIAPTDDGLGTRVQLFVDYQLVPARHGKETVAGRLTYATGYGGRLVLNNKDKASEQIAGRFDSLRFSKGALAPEKFLRKTRDGLMCVVR